MTTLRGIALAAALVAASGVPSDAQVAFLAPIDCDLGSTCFIQNYVDRDEGPSFKDFTCGPLGYDGHKGTDFALPDLAMMEKGVAVLAPAAGKVTGTRDGMTDIAIDMPGAPPLEGRDCGNGIGIDHGNGWTSQLCHMRQGSVAVSTGDLVTAGQPLGLVGLSGNTQFPHVHITVWKDNTVVDPFHPAPVTSCGQTPQGSLWSPPLAYVPGGVTALGITDTSPDFRTVQAGLPTPETIPASAPALIVWALFFGTRQGDEITLNLMGPGGAIADQTIAVDRTQARSFRFSGRKAREPWAAGDYRAEVSLRRGGLVVDSATIATTIK
ncbi:MAG: M23 family metallopeptidase [Gemmobacter sp.]|nr:M23 family metallopeptidase [Gemmobacter sp.]